MKPELANFRMDELMRQLEVEFDPLARAKGLKLTFVPSGLSVRSDRRLLRRLLQNLVSNAVKYTPQGRVLIGCRRHGGRVRIDVYDTGLGIPQSKKKAVFKEFHRLDQGRQGGAWLGPRAVDRGAHRARTRPPRGAEIQARAGFAFLRRGAARAHAAERCARAHGAAFSMPASLPAWWCYASITSRRSSTAWRRCSVAGAAACSRHRT